MRAQFFLRDRRQEIWLELFKGTVIGQQKWSETRVQAYANVFQTSTGNVPQTFLSSSAITRHEFQSEVPVSLTGQDVVLREGHVITVVWGASVRKSAGPYSRS